MSCFIFQNQNGPLSHKTTSPTWRQPSHSRPDPSPPSTKPQPAHRRLRRTTLPNRCQGLVLNITDGLMLRGYLHHQVHGQGSSQSQDQGQGHPSQGEKRASTPSNKLLKTAMVMMLSGHQVRFESSKDRWDFFFVGETFSFSRTPATEEAFLDSLNQDSFGFSPVEKVSVYDLAIVIGPGPGDNDTTSRKVDRAKLFRWLGATLDITNFGQRHPNSPRTSPHPRFPGYLHLPGKLRTAVRRCAACVSAANCEDGRRLSFVGCDGVYDFWGAGWRWGWIF